MQKIRERLKTFHSFGEGEDLRRKLKKFADENYQQKYSDKEYIDFLSRHSASIRKVHPQSQNHPYYLEMFTCLTQHIHADNIRQLLDKAIDIEQKNF